MLELDRAWMYHAILTLPPLLLSLTLHEYAHARTALAFGDPTARNMGRVSLNPLRHLDLMGTLMLIFSGLIGWVLTSVRAQATTTRVASRHAARKDRRTNAGSLTRSPR